MKSIKDLRDNLLDNFESVKKGNLDPKRANAMSNTGGKILGTVNAELKYAQMKDKEPEISFLEYKN